MYVRVYRGLVSRKLFFFYMLHTSFVVISFYFNLLLDLVVRVQSKTAFIHKYIIYYVHLGSICAFDCLDPYLTAWTGYRG